MRAASPALPAALPSARRLNAWLARCLALSLALSLAPSPAAHAAPPSIELLELPNHLTLPLPDGSNRLFEVRITGKPTAIWMAAAVDSAAERRLPLNPMGDRWVFNLGDPRVAATLAGARQFQVFATFADGRRAESLPVQFVPANPAAVEVRLQGTDERALQAGLGPQWVSPKSIHALALSWSGSGIRRPVTLAIGETRTTIAPGPEGSASVSLTADQHTAWQTAGKLEVLDPDGQPIAVVAATPDRLALDGPTALRIVQRSSAYMPGSREFLRVYLGDISGSSTTVSIVAPDGTVLVSERVARDGDRIEFALPGARYVLRIERLVNMLMGDDHADLVVEPAVLAPAAPAPGVAP